jgi:hypothetical protein
VSMAFRFCALFLLLSLLPSRTMAASQVTAELFIPSAETYVIGDSIPLIWRFENQGAQPVAFLWEGCCRLNGRLEVRAPGKKISPIPPGQALAHMFAKAEQLQPSTPREFETRLSDWTVLHESGAYTLQGNYTGVLPQQTPLIPRGLTLWRDAAQTPPIQLTVLSAPDYLEQSSDRAARRKLHLGLSGPAELPPLEAIPLSLTISNTAPATRTVIWPNDFQVWVLDSDGQRSANVPTGVGGSYEELTIPGGAAVSKTIPFHSDRLEGEPFGSYQIFIDLAESSAGISRVPSNPIPLNWNLDARQVQSLIERAAQGPAAGLRNPPLKLLRVHLAEIQPSLIALQSVHLEPKPAELRNQLELASSLKPLAPQPGQVNWTIAVAPSGRLRWREEALAERLPAAAAIPDQVAAMLRVRRHLGWDISIRLEPSPELQLRQIGLIVSKFKPLAGDLAGPLHASFPNQEGNTPGLIRFRTAPLPANLVLRLSHGPGGVLGLHAAWRLPHPDQPHLTRMFSPAELTALDWRDFSGATALEEFLARNELRYPQTVVFADPTVAWEKIQTVLHPLLRRGLAVELVITPLEPLNSNN